MKEEISSYMKGKPGANLTIDEMIGVGRKLQQLLTQENDMLRRLQVKDLGPLQAERQKLSTQLERFQKQLINGNPPIAMTDESRETMLILADDIALKAEENLHQTAVAQQVNRRVLQMIVDMLNEQQRLAVYGQNGAESRGQAATLSVNINQHA